METTFGMDKQVYSVNGNYEIVDFNKLYETGFVTRVVNKSFIYDKVVVKDMEHFFCFTDKMDYGDKRVNTLSLYAGDNITGNLVPLSQTELSERLNSILSVLNTSYGIKLSKDNLKPYISEINANIELDEPFNSYYTDLFNALIVSAIRHRRSSNKSTTPKRDTGYIAFKNQNIELKIYDKKSALASENVHIPSSKDIARFEIVYKQIKSKEEYMDGKPVEEIKKEIYKKMLLPYLKDLFNRQKVLQKYLKEFKNNLDGSFSSSKKQEFIFKTLAIKSNDETINVLDITEVLFCIYKLDKSKNEERTIESLSKLYQKLNYSDYIRYFNNHKRLLEIITKMEILEQDKYIHLLKEMEDFHRKILQKCGKMRKTKTQLKTCNFKGLKALKSKN